VIAYCYKWWSLPTRHRYGAIADKGSTFCQMSRQNNQISREKDKMKKESKRQPAKVLERDEEHKLLSWTKEFKRLVWVF